MRKIFIDMKSILKILFILTTCSLIIHAHNHQCTCGNLGEGKNPCSCSDVVVKAAKLPKPTYYVPSEQIKDAASARYSVSITTSQSNSDSGANGNGNSNGCSDGSSSSNSNTYSTSSSSDSSGSIVIYDTDASSSDSTSESNSGCGCKSKSQSQSQNRNQNVETLEIDDSQSSNGDIVPSFSPVGDLCYPLPVDSRTGRIVEKTTRVVPAYPGKIVCQNCNPSSSQPYQICVNSLTGEIISRKSISSSSSTASRSGSLIYENSNSAPVNSGDSSITSVVLEKNGVIRGSTSKSFSGSRVSLRTNTNSGIYGRSTSGTYKLPLVYANLNSASGQAQRSRVTLSGSSSDCFDDTPGGTQVDYSYPTMPADAVSLTLAYKNLRAPNVIYRQGKQFIPEDKLSFGHRTVPNDVKTETKISDIAEEKLVTVDRPVVELKLAPPRTVVIGSYDEREEAKLAELEAIERESITHEETVDHMSDSLLTYKDLGYAPVGTTYAQSTSYNGAINYNGELSDSAEEPCGPLGPPLPDYIPGRVVVQQEVIQNSEDSINGGSMDIRQSSRSSSCPT